MSELQKRLRKAGLQRYLMLTDSDLMDDAADALDAQAQEIARLTRKLPCGHLETDADSYGGCAACGVLRSLESAEKNCDVWRKKASELAAGNRALRARLAKAEAEYADLIFRVSEKHPGESRHETARRYIEQAERATEGAAQADAARGGA